LLEISLEEGSGLYLQQGWEILWVGKVQGKAEGRVRMGGVFGRDPVGD